MVDKPAVGCFWLFESQNKARASHESRLCYWQELTWWMSGILNWADWYLVRPCAQQTWGHCLAMICKTLISLDSGEVCLLREHRALGMPAAWQAANRFENTEIKLCSSRITRLKWARVKGSVPNHSVYEQHQHLRNAAMGDHVSI